MSVSTHIATTSAGAVRLVTLRLSEAEKARAAASRSIGSYVGAFLEKEIRDPFRYKQFSASSFAISATCSDTIFTAYILDLHDRLKQFLFGTDKEGTTRALLFSGSNEDIAKFLSEPVEDAIRRSEAYIEKTTAAQNSPEERASTQRITPIQGKRQLLFRGILECKNDVLLAYAITPANHSDYSGDLDLTDYLAFRGVSAIDFEIRVMEHASHVLQNVSDKARPVVFLCPLSYGTLLSNQKRQHFIDALHQQPGWVRDHMIISVIGAPPAPPSSAVQRYTAEFSRLFKYLDWQVTDPAFPVQNFMGSHLHSVTLHLTENRPDRTADLDMLIQKIPKLRQLKIRAAVSGLETPDELLASRTGGIIYASGNAVTEALETFQPARRVLLNELPIVETLYIAA